MRVAPSTVTWCSAIASSSADCVFGIARLISSTSTTLAKIGPGAELELALLLVVDREAGDVGRLQVRRALDARRRRALDRLRDRAGEDGLRGAGDVLEEHVAAADQRGDDELDLLALAVDDGLDVVDEAVGERVRALEPLVFRVTRGQRRWAPSGLHLRRRAHFVSNLAAAALGAALRGALVLARRDPRAGRRGSGRSPSGSPTARRSRSPSPRPTR